MDPAVRIRPDVVDVVVGSRSMSAHALWLGGIPRGAVLLLFDAQTTDYDAAEAMNELAGHGYESVGAKAADADDDAEHLLLEALVAQLAARGWADEQIGLVGFGSGGRAALLAAAGSTFGGAVSVAATGIAELVAEPQRLGAGAGLRTPWLGMFGADDARVSRQVLSTLVATLGPLSPVYTELVRYPGVAVGFYRDSHRALGHAAAFDSWQRIVEWLDARVVPRPTPLAEAWRARQAAER